MSDYLSSLYYIKFLDLNFRDITLVEENGKNNPIPTILKTIEVQNTQYNQQKIINTICNNMDFVTTKAILQQAPHDLRIYLNPYNNTALYERKYSVPLSC